MPASPARVAAFKVLLRVEQESSYAVELLHSDILDGISPADRNLTTEIVMGVLRWRSVLDHYIAYFSFSPLPKLDLEVLTALRMGAYQIRFLRVASHAAVNETVELVKQARKVSAAGLSNAVMRKILALQNAGKQLSLPLPPEIFAHPEWLTGRWRQQFGEETLSRICKYDQQPPETSLRLPGTAEERKVCEEELREAGIEVASGTLLRSARRLVTGDFPGLAAYREGRIAIQDEGSQLVAALVGNGERILDCCAAPGGKTGAIASRLPHAEIVAAELHPHRARILRERAPQANVKVITADAVQLPFSDVFDRVLADVPCSGTGTLARNPEIKWKLRPEDLLDLQHRQLSILKAAMKHVAVGGRVIYSTCSLEPEENQAVVRKALMDTDSFRLIPIRGELHRLAASGELIWENVDQLLQGDFLRTIPGVQPCDGFFAAVLERTS
jgi:16S rRNA (cytosine967-C5)-methyltransferase